MRPDGTWFELWVRPDAPLEGFEQASFPCAACGRTVYFWKGNPPNSPLCAACQRAAELPLPKKEAGEWRRPG